MHLKSKVLSCSLRMGIHNMQEMFISISVKLNNTC